jgi:hypothetical protein
VVRVQDEGSVAPEHPQGQLEAAGAHGARVQPPWRRRGVGLPAVRSQGHLGGESAATVRTTVLGGGA